MGNSKTNQNVHHNGTDRENAIRWRIVELNEDVESLLLYCQASSDIRVRIALRRFANMCNEAIDTLAKGL